MPSVLSSRPMYIRLSAQCAVPPTPRDHPPLRTRLPKVVCGHLGVGQGLPIPGRSGGCKSAHFTPLPQPTNRTVLTCTLPAGLVSARGDRRRDDRRPPHATTRYQQTDRRPSGLDILEEGPPEAQLTLTLTLTSDWADFSVL